MKKQAGETTVAGKILGPLDLTQADPTAEIKSLNRIGGEQWRGGFYIYMACDIAIADIALAIAYRGRKGVMAFNIYAMSDAIWGGAITYEPLDGEFDWTAVARLQYRVGGEQGYVSLLYMRLR